MTQDSGRHADGHTAACALTTDPGTECTCGPAAAVVLAVQEDMLADLSQEQRAVYDAALGSARAGFLIARAHIVADDPQGLVSHVTVYEGSDEIARSASRWPAPSPEWARLRSLGVELTGPWTAAGDGEWTAAVRRILCPCCQRPLPLSGAVCAECRDAGCEGSEFATAEQPYPYCAATDSGPLA